MTSGVDWVQTGDGVALDWVHDSPPVFVEHPPPPAEPWSLQSLTDVEGTEVAPAGNVLAKDDDGQWRPAAPSAASTMGFRHDQTSASAVWTIHHNLGRFPSSVTLHASGLVSDYDEFVVQHLSVNTLRVSMDAPTAGVALII